MSGISRSNDEPDEDLAASARLPHLGLIFDASPFATLVFTTDLVLIDANAAHARMTGVPVEALRGRPMFEVFPKNAKASGPDTEALIRASVARVVEREAPDEPPVQRHDLPREGGFDRRYWRMIHSPVFDGGELVAIRQDAWDITEAVLLSERQKTLQRIAGKIAGIAFWEQDVEADTLIRTPEFDEIFGFPPPGNENGGAMAAGRPTSIAPFRQRVHPEDAPLIEKAFAAMAEEGPGCVRQIEYRVVRPDGDIRQVAVSGEMGVGDAGQPVVIGTSLDVTELHANEARLESLLADKEALLGEVNHRVKNSLQLVSSILSLEARQAGENERARLVSAAARVQAVSAVHSLLYHDDDIRTVEFGGHLRDFCRRLGDGLGAKERGIALVVDAEAVTLAAEKAIPLSLIVNELVTNAFKYAFPETAPTQARINVTFVPRDGGGLRLTVSDNGTISGPAASPVSTSSSSAPPSTGLGTRLVDTLARQIGATVTKDIDKGWRTTVDL